MLTIWEADFLAAVGSQDYDLTPAQEAKANEIEEPLVLHRLRQAIEGGDLERRLEALEGALDQRDRRPPRINGHRPEVRQ